MPINPYQLAEQARKNIKTDTIPFRGGAVTAIEAEQLESGRYSDVQNMRNMHPGMKKRPGQQRINSTAEGSSYTTLFEFSKGKKTERHFFAQKTASCVLEGGVPPASITGSFGTIVFTEAANPKPGAWTIITDKMLFTNGVDTPQIYPGIETPIEKFIVCKDAAPHPLLPEKGLDYSLETMDDDTSTKAVLNSLGDYDNDYDCIYIMSPIPVKSLNWTMGNVNSLNASISINYWNGSWISLTSVVDNTSAAASCTLGKNGSMAWSPPTDEITKYMYGVNGFWYQIYLKGGSLSGLVDVTKLTYDASFQPIQNVWDAVPVNPIVANIWSSHSLNASKITTEAFDAINITSLTPDDKIYIATIDPVEGFYVNMGATPNSHVLTMKDVGIFCGSTWSTASNLVDGTAGLTKSGWIHFRRHTSVQPAQMSNMLNYAYWYYLQTSGNSTSSNLVVGVQAQPFFNIVDLGKGLAVCAWKDRACYVFDKTPNYIHVSETGQPLHINGSDYAILKAGDGRSNKIVCLKGFYNELMSWQEEKGVDGGTLTLFEGYSPDTFGKLVLSNRVGTFSSKSAVVIDGVLTSTRTDDQVRTLAFWISHYGIFMTDGRVVQSISDDIQNYFDPTQSECIRFGYEDKMWIGYDSAFNVLRVGLVSGSSATSCNVFPVYDLVDRKWTFDSLGQALNCYIEVEAGSGNVPFIQVGGGADGYIYRLNSGQNDVTTAINAYARMEINAQGNDFMLKDMKLRHKVQTAGNISVIPYQNGVEKASFTIPMTAENTSETIRRMRKTIDMLGNNVALKIGNASASNDLILYDIGLNIEVFDDR